MQFNCIKNTNNTTKENVDNLHIVKDKHKKIDKSTIKRNRKRKRRDT